MIDMEPYGLHLPIFPMLHGALSEERIERMVERMFDVADEALMAGKCTQAQYDAWSRRLDAYAEELFAQVSRS